MSDKDLLVALEVLKRDYTKLSARIRQLEHSTTCDCAGVTIRLHFPSISQGKATVTELVDAIIHYISWFTLPRREIDKVYALYGTVTPEEFQLRTSQLFQSAISLFKRANKATNRNGEAGEFILFLLTEWILSAPQILAKMALKTNSQMAVLGADGVHARYSKEDDQLLMYWGESKLYANVSDAIAAAIKSINDANDPEQLKHELELVSRNLTLSGLDESAQDAMLRQLDPFDDEYNKKIYVTTCLIGFNCTDYSKVTEADGNWYLESLQ